MSLSPNAPLMPVVVLGVAFKTVGMGRFRMGLIHIWHETADTPDGAAELPDTRMSHQTVMNEI